MNKKIVIVGASSAIAEQCARLWLPEASFLFLIARDGEKLQAIKSDLAIRNPKVNIISYVLDFLNAEEVSKVVASICTQGVIDIVLIAQAMMPAQIDCQNDLTLIEKLININITSVIWFSELFLQHMENNNHGNLAIISSTAGDRGRRKNYIYGASKAMLNCYTAGLRHRFYNSKIKISLIKPGPTISPMTAHLNQKRFAKAEQVAHNIVAGIKKDKAIIYTPFKWKFIMFVIKIMPQFILNRLNI